MITAIIAAGVSFLAEIAVFTIVHKKHGIGAAGETVVLWLMFLALVALIFFAYILLIKRIVKNTTHSLDYIDRTFLFIGLYGTVGFIFALIRLSGAVDFPIWNDFGRVITTGLRGFLIGEFLLVWIRFLWFHLFYWKIKFKWAQNEDESIQVFTGKIMLLWIATLVLAVGSGIGLIFAIRAGVPALFADII